MLAREYGHGILPDRLDGLTAAIDQATEAMIANLAENVADLVDDETVTVLANPDRRHHDPGPRPEGCTHGWAHGDGCGCGTPESGKLGPPP